MWGHVLRIHDGQSVIKLVDDSLFEFANALLAFGRSKMADWSSLSCVGSLLFLYADGAAQLIEAFTVLGREPGTDGHPLPTKTLLEAQFIWVSEVYSHHRDTLSAVMYFCGEILSPQASDSGLRTAFYDHMSMFAAKPPGMFWI